MMKLFNTLDTRPSLRWGRLFAGMTASSVTIVFPAKAGIQQLQGFSGFRLSAPLRPE